MRSVAAGRHVGAAPGLFRHGRGAQVFADAIMAASRGLWSRTSTAPYAAGRRDSAWVKLKPRHTFDLVVTAAEWGYGRRQGWLSNLHLAARDPAPEN